MTKEIQAKDAEMQVGGRSNFDETRNLAKKGSSCLCSTIGGASFSLLLFPVPILSYMWGCNLLLFSDLPLQCCLQQVFAR